LCGHATGAEQKCAVRNQRKRKGRGKGGDRKSSKKKKGRKENMKSVPSVLLVKKSSPSAGPTRGHINRKPGTGKHHKKGY